jgi:hypothetical protein
VKAKQPSKQQMMRARVGECAQKVATLTNALQRDYQPEIVVAAVNRWLANQREAKRIARERAALRAQQADLNKRASKL